MEIKLLKGIKDIDFGISKYEFVKKLGTDLSFEIIEEEGDFKTEAVFVEEYGSSLYFEGIEIDMTFAACDTQNKDAVLFGEKIFNKSKAEIKVLMKENTYKDLEEEIEEWGEERLDYYDARVDFYFDGGKLRSVSWGVE
ncbi:MAG: hypothetical protein B6I18_07855 [Bacteroidetes bacterium 4572_112]|nr:MAG: hypothetical protein B6I18_07855 [Bacteroidetes bacterium 4572_112]